MTRTAVATDDGDEEARDGVLAEIAGLLRKHGHTPETGLQADLRALTEKVDKLTELTREGRRCGCCGHSQHYWYPSSMYTTTMGAAPANYTVSYGTTQLT